MKTFMMLSALLLAGCVTASQTYAPDGRQAFSISCPGMMRNLGDCYQKAGEVCGAAGYVVLSQDRSTGYLSTSSFVVNQGGAYGNGTSGNIMSRSILISCKGEAISQPPAAPPSQ